MNTAPGDLRALVGGWTGRNALWFTAESPAMESAATAQIRMAAGDRYLVIDYTWSHDGQPHDGHLVLRLADRLGAVDAVWVDSFHQGGTFMLLAGATSSAASLSARGSYAAPTGPDWGWGITVSAASANRCQVLMHNITPDGVEAMAVRMELSRA